MRDWGDTNSSDDMPKNEERNCVGDCEMTFITSWTIESWKGGIFPLQLIIVDQQCLDVITLFPVDADRNTMRVKKWMLQYGS